MASVEIKEIWGWYDGPTYGWCKCVGKDCMFFLDEEHCDIVSNAPRAYFAIAVTADELQVLREGRTSDHDLLVLKLRERPIFERFGEGIFKGLPRPH